MLRDWWNGSWAQSKVLGIQKGILSIFAVGMVVGVIGWGGFNTVMEATNTLGFCISCHEMETTVYAEYVKTVHYKNRTGVRAGCPDCHVPRPWVHKMIRKIQASRELYHKVMGTVDTPEKFEQHRLELAKRVWDAMKSTDSRECRNCHNFSTMDPEKQKKRARKQHANAQEEGLTCIDCHKGIAHKPVHHLLEEESEGGDDGFGSDDGFGDDEEKPAKKAKAKPAEEKVASAAPAKPAAPAPVATEVASASGVDFTAVTETDMVLFYPGQASMEWILKGSDHGGGRAVKKGEKCSSCHVGEEKAIGKKIVSGEKAEATPIPGKRPFIELKTKTKVDNGNLFIQMSWADDKHTPVPFVDGGKMDPKNQVKVAMMIAGEGVKLADQAGCWVTCHHDSRYMPDAPKEDAMAAVQGIDLSTGVTKYLAESRTKIEVNGRGDKPRGGWDKLKSADEIAAVEGEGKIMDIIRWNSGDSSTENGHVLAERTMTGGLAAGTGELKDGIWTVTISRPLAASGPGDIALEAGKAYTVGFAIHDDFTTARFHHVSFNYLLTIGEGKAQLSVPKDE